ncbi:hypothetical protein ESZ50_04750 [Weissella muntiaci]|uniref:DUF2190 family protein n=1 Tax=Weissella muntiaci TaxID=2508881 RepID=A0A6C2C7M0_9LACO|nr:hypothetical protein [Weissella muntiaci]TYC49904.1 hypothetical protein ESZ50_04750 [Weissella muntiaci]
MSENKQGRQYMDGKISVGHVADTSLQQVRTEPAGEVIPYGAPLTLVDGVVKVAKPGDSFIGIARAFEGLIDTFETKVGAFNEKEPVSVLYAGSIGVVVAEAITSGAKAIIAADGKFKAAVAETEQKDIVGTFWTDGSVDGIATLHI